jgi:prepilin-type N-terminal cleavage/methylation domain-containing protein
MKRTQGFTLLEILIALAILGVGVLAVVQMFPLGLQQTRQAVQRQISAELAGSRLARLRAEGAEALLTTGNLAAASSIYDLYAGRHHLVEGFEGTVQRMRGAANTYLQRVTFTVTMTDGSTQQFVTYVARR